MKRDMNEKSDLIYKFEDILAKEEDTNKLVKVNPLVKKKGFYYYP